MTMTGEPEYGGIYPGFCQNNKDPEGLSRITATCPQVFGNNTTLTDWAWPCFSPGSKVSPPVPGEGVWLMFQGGDVEHPVWLGVWK